MPDDKDATYEAEYDIAQDQLKRGRQYEGHADFGNDEPSLNDILSGQTRDSADGNNEEMQITRGNDPDSDDGGLEGLHPADDTGRASRMDTPSNAGRIHTGSESNAH